MGQIKDVSLVEDVMEVIGTGNSDEIDSTLRSSPDLFTTDNNEVGIVFKSQLFIEESSNFSNSDLEQNIILLSNFNRQIEDLSAYVDKYWEDRQSDLMDFVLSSALEIILWIQLKLIYHFRLPSNQNELNDKIDKFELVQKSEALHEIPDSGLSTFYRLAFLGFHAMIAGNKIQTLEILTKLSQSEKIPEEMILYHSLVCLEFATYLDEADLEILFFTRYKKELLRSGEESNRDELPHSIDSKALFNEFELEHHIISRSPKMALIFDILKRRAKSNLSIFVTGETGTGKELIVNAIHNISGRKGENPIDVNVSAISKNLIESELFGHVKGSFTGAISDYRGKIRMADKGTLFLDEVGEMVNSVQVKLLRVLETKEVSPVGSADNHAVDFRLVSATNADIDHLVREGLFRKDLLSRIRSFEIHLPPLKERIEDIPHLAEYFFDKFIDKNSNGGKFKPDLKDFEILRSREWEENIRELRNFIEVIVVDFQSLENNDHSRSKFLELLGWRSNDIIKMESEASDFSKSYHTLKDNNLIEPFKRFIQSNYSRKFTAEILTIDPHTVDNSINTFLLIYAGEFGLDVDKIVNALAKDEFQISDNRKWLDENVVKRIDQCIQFKKSSGKKKPYLALADEIVNELRLK